MKVYITILAFTLTSLSLTAQTTRSKTSPKPNSATQVKKQKRPLTSHTGPGLDNTGTSAITITHNDTANYQGPGKKGAAAQKGVNSKTAPKKNKKQ